MKTWQILLLSALSGICYAVALPPFNIWPLAIVFCLLITALALDLNNLKYAALAGLTASLFAALIGYRWIAYVSAEFGNLPAALSWFIMILHGLVAELNFILFLVFAVWIKKWFFKRPQFKHRSSLLLLVFASLFCLLEMSTPKIFNDYLAHAFIETHWLNGIIDIFGPFSLTFICFLSAVILYDVFILRGSKKLVIALVLLLASTVTYSTWKDSLEQERVKIGDPVSFGLVQGNIGNAFKLASEWGSDTAIDRTVSTYIRLSNELLETSSPDVLIWPETAYPRAIENGRLPLEILEYAFSLKPAFVFGGYDVEIKGFTEYDYNALFLIDRTSPPQKVYRKNVLLAFGEYFPFSDTFPFLKGLIPAISDFSRGTGPAVLDLEIRDLNLPFAPLICYEILIPEFVRQSVKQGARFIINLTNDSWFGPTTEPLQHLALSRFRAIEHRVPIIRATNTGISGFIDTRGKIIAQSALMQEATVSQTMAIPKSAGTVYTRFGSIPLILLAFLGILLPLWRAKAVPKDETHV